ncbi:dehydrogenase, partial [Sulfolobus sp. D5]
MFEQTILRFHIYDLFSEIFLYKIDDRQYQQMIDKINKAEEKLGDLVKEIAKVDLSEIRQKFFEKKKSDYLVEYSTLFLTGLGYKPLTPVESKRFFVISGEKIALFKYQDITRFYGSRRLLIKFGDNFVHEPDHISTILAFMSYLVKEEYEIRKENRDLFKILSDEYNFMTTHIISWIPDWANDVINDNRADIFKVVCKNLNNWIEYDY